MTDVNSLIGARLRIEYFDQNELFASVLPRYATIIRRMQAEHNVDDWFLLKLDEPFDYPISRKDSSALEPLHCDQILIRSRWKGFRVGDGEPTSVFILLIRDEKHLTKEPIQIEEFFHVAWGMSHTLSV